MNALKNYLASNQNKFTELGYLTLNGEADSFDDMSFTLPKLCNPNAATLLNLIISGSGDFYAGHVLRGLIPFMIDVLLSIDLICNGGAFLKTAITDVNLLIVLGIFLVIFEIWHIRELFVIRRIVRTDNLQKMMIAINDQKVKVETPQPQPIIVQAPQVAEKKQTNLTFLGQKGCFQGMTMPIHRFPSKIGRDPSQCKIQFPEGTEGVSRVHCTIYESNGSFTVVDSSTYGTFINGKKLSPNTPVRLNNCDYLAIGSSNQVFSVKIS